MSGTARLRAVLRHSRPFVLMFLVFGFSLYAVMRGISVNAPGEAVLSRFIHVDDGLATRLIYAHMVSGGVLTFLAPVQLVHPLRRRWPVVHRASGYLIAALALVTAICGSVYILRQGTIGGPWMSAGFGLYGLLLGVAAVQAVRKARARDATHRDWALRLIVLALGSWLFRLHYAIWEVSTGGIASNPEFTGLFDRIQVFAFYLPYLALLEIWLRRHKGRGSTRLFPERAAR